MSRELYQQRVKEIEVLRQANQESLMSYITNYMDAGECIYAGENYIDIKLNNISGIVTIYYYYEIKDVNSGCPLKMPSNKEEAIRLFDELALLTKVARQAYMAYKYWRY